MHRCLTTVLVLTAVFALPRPGCSQFLENSQSIEILQVEPGSTEAIIPCLFNDLQRHPLYLFHKQSQVATYQDESYDPKTGFKVKIDGELPMLGLQYDCRAPSNDGRWGPGGQYKVVRLVPNWGIVTEPPKRKVQLTAEQDLKLKCSSRIPSWKPLTILRNFSDVDPSCTSESNEVECTVPAGEGKVEGRYFCVSGGSHLQDPGNLTVLQSQIVASWRIDVLHDSDRINVQLQQSNSTLKCIADRNELPSLQYCTCESEEECGMVLAAMQNISKCETIISAHICNASETGEEAISEANKAAGRNTKVLALGSLDTSRVFRCSAKATDEQSVNCAQAFTLVKPGAPPGLKPEVIAVIIVITVLLLGTVGLALFYRQKFVIEKFKVQKLTEREIYEFIHGNQNEIDNQKDMAEQAHLLPYDQRLEFPMNRLHMGKQLGAGAYGTVYKAEAYGLCDRDSDEATTVAVKTITPHADDMFFRALLMELKIMAYIGKHINVVCLLGAVTENIETREVYLVMEYCQYGNLHEFLNKNAQTFVSQLGDGQTITTTNRYSGAGSTGGSQHGAPAGGGHYENAWEMTDVKSGDKAAEPIDGEPLWRSNLQGDSEESDLLEFNTTTLMSWSLQIARGMSYLASKRIIHGDLATRNVLIAAGHVVKVADFGLARQVYQNPEYTKTQKNPLPIKWMAIESLTRMAFSSQSDVWAFGVTLWEIFSLGETPYQGQQIGEEFVEKLRNGYRMRKPRYCPAHVFKLMKQCWEAEPSNRPTFEKICSVFSELLVSKAGEYANVFTEPEDEPTYGNV